MSTTAVLSIHIKVVLTSNIYRRSAPSSERPQLVVTTTPLKPSLLTVEVRGEKDSGTVLTDDFRFRAQHFDFYDLTTSKPVVHDLFPGTCQPWDTIETDDVKELHSSTPNVTRLILDHEDPISDPMNMLEIGHEYCLALKPQKVRCWDRSVNDMFGDRSFILAKEAPGAIDITLVCEDELLLKIEA